MIPDCPLSRHSGVGRNPAIENMPRSGQNQVLSHLRGDLLINWIPAYAGMTQFWLMDNLG